MSESHHNQPNPREAKVREGLADLEAMLDYADSLPQDDTDRLKLNEALFNAVDGHVQNDPFYGGGHTIPGTDEWIPGERHDRYTYNTEDSKTGETYSITLPTEFGKRLEAFAAAQRPILEAKQQEAAVAQPLAEGESEAVVLPFKKPKSSSKEAKAEVGESDYDPDKRDQEMAERVAKLATNMKRAGFDVEVADEPTGPKASGSVKVTNRQRGGAHRAQGPADKDNADSKDHAPKHRKPGQGVTHKRDAIADLVELDASGRARYQAGAVEHARDKSGTVLRDDNGDAITRGIAARFMSKYELGMIEAYQDLIRDGLADRNKVDTAGPDTDPDADPSTPPILPTPDSSLPGVIDPPNQAPDTDPGAVAQVARKTLKQRLKAVMTRAGKELYLLPQTLKDGAGKIVEYLNDKDKGRRRGIVAGVVGVAAVGGAVLASKYGSDLFGHTPQTHGTAAGGGVNKELADLLSGKGGSSGSGAGTGEAIRSHMTLHQGDTIWSDIASSASRHGHHLSDEQIQHLTQQTLNANGLSWEEARHLPVGYRFEVPEEVKQAITKKAA